METLKYKYIRVFCLALGLILAGCATKKVSKVYDAPPPAIPSADGNLFEKATRAQEQGQFEEAEKLWKRFMERHPNSYEAHNNLGEVYYLQDKLTQSLKEFDTAFRLEPVSDKIRKNYKRVLEFQLTLLNESREFDRVMEGLKRLKEISLPGDKENIQFKIERIEDKIFEEVRRSDSAQDYREFLNKYPDGVNGDAARRRLQELEGPGPQTSKNAPLLDGAEPIPAEGGTLENLTPYDEPSPILEDDFIDEEGLGTKTEISPSWSKSKPTQEARRTEPAPSYDGFFYNEPVEKKKSASPPQPLQQEKPLPKTTTKTARLQEKSQPIASPRKQEKAFPKTTPKIVRLQEKPQPIASTSSVTQKQDHKNKPAVTVIQQAKTLKLPLSKPVKSARVVEKTRPVPSPKKVSKEAVHKKKSSLIARTYAKDGMSPTPKPFPTPKPLMSNSEMARSDSILAKSEGLDIDKGLAGTPENTAPWSRQELESPRTQTAKNNTLLDGAKPLHSTRGTLEETIPVEEAFPGMENEQFDEESFGSWTNDSPWGEDFENPKEARRYDSTPDQRRFSNRIEDEVSVEPQRVPGPERSQNTKANMESPSKNNPATPVEKAKSEIQMVVVDIESGTLNVRAAPSTSGKVVGQLKDGEARPFLDEIQKWYRIEYKNGLTGWVSRQYTRKQVWHPSSRNLQGEKLSHLHFKEYYSKR
jgi:outer membrane protein assembly factor BamD (BamD/ComL family)